MISTVAIIGGGLAGGVVAQTLRTEGFDGRILIFGDEPYHPYDRPSLSKAALLAGDSEPSEIFKAGWAEAAGVEFTRGVRIRRIDPDIATLTLESGETVRADRLVLATGARARRISLPGSDLRGLHVLRHWADTLALRDILKPGMNLAVVGGGLIGCEIATTATKIGASVTLVEAGGELLERVLGADIGAFCRGELLEMGVVVHRNTQVSAFAGSSRVTAIHGTGGQHIKADLVLISVGGEPAKDLAVEAGLACTTGVQVDAFGMTSSPNVYAAGDVACWPLRSGGSRCLETYLNSQSQGETVARALLGKGQASPQVPKSWTEIAGHRIQVVGDIVGPGRRLVRQKTDGGVLHFRIDPDGGVAAAVSVDAPGDFAMAMRLVEGQARPDTGQLCDPDVPLRRLLQPKK